MGNKVIPDCENCGRELLRDMDGELFCTCEPDLASALDDQYFEEHQAYHDYQSDGGSPYDGNFYED